MENQTQATQNTTHFVTYAYSKDFHGKAPDYAVDHGEGIGYDLQLECMFYTTSLEEAEHDILEYAKKYTNKEKPLFGFHVFERPGNAYIITTQEGAIERTSERWYGPDGTLVAKSDTSTVASDPEEKRMFKGWESTNFKKGDIVEFYTPKRHYVALGIVISDVCPPDVAEMLHDRHGNRCGYDADKVLIVTPNYNEQGSFGIGTSLKYSRISVHTVNVFKPSLPFAKTDEIMLRFVEETERRRVEALERVSQELLKEKQQKEAEEKTTLRVQE
jgi:hypothetical protein